MQHGCEADGWGNEIKCQSQHDLTDKRQSNRGALLLGGGDTGANQGVGMQAHEKALACRQGLGCQHRGAEGPRGIDS